MAERHGEEGGARSPQPGQEMPESLAQSLLTMARGVVESVVQGRGVPPEPDPGQLPAEMQEHAGVFVTLRRREDESLRGCIGTLAADRPLWRALREAATGAALRDPRFKPVRPEELDGLAYEVSVLSGFQEVEGPEQVEVGRHGLIVRADGKQGLLLPQVATRQGWGSERFVAETCRKAGLPQDRWRQPDLTLLVFEARVVEEPLSS